MALSLGKLTILAGAGLLGSVLAQEGRVSQVSDFFSGAFKIVFKHIKQDDPPKSKPKSDALLDQVNRLREELQQLAPSGRRITIITGRRPGATTLGVPVVVIIVVGYGYIWWKGWKLSDMMFATRRSLSEASTAIAKQLEQVYSSISDAKKQLSSRINSVDASIHECKELGTATRDEVAQLQGDLSCFGVDVESVQRAVQTLETKIGRIEEKQDFTNQGVFRLVHIVNSLEQRRKTECIQSSPTTSSKPALELPQSLTRTESSPPAVPEVGLVSPTSYDQIPKRPLQSVSSASKVQGISDIIKDTGDMSVGVSNAAEQSSNSSSISSRFGWKLPGLNAALLTRTRSATYSK